jgi:hypothetical protein
MDKFTSLVNLFYPTWDTDTYFNITVIMTDVLNLDNVNWLYGQRVGSRPISIQFIQSVFIHSVLHQHGNDWK